MTRKIQKSQKPAGRKPFRPSGTPRQREAAAAPGRQAEAPRAKAGERVAKTIARAGLGSRREAEAWVAAGRVAINGVVIASPAVNVTARDKVTVDGKALDPRLDIHAFTPNGFEWSYEGAEPRQLALAILAAHLGDAAAANELVKALVEPFMKAVVANFGNEWEMTSADIDADLAAIRKQQAPAR